MQIHLDIDIDVERDISIDVDMDIYGYSDINEIVHTCMYICLCIC